MSKDLGKRIEDLMKKYNYTQRELAQDIGISTSALSRYISGEREPKADVIANLATALNTNSEYLMTGEEKNKNEIFTLVTRNVDVLSDEEKKELINIILQHLGGK